MEEIILGGVSITKLKQQRGAVRKDAAEFMSTNIAKAEAIVQELLELDENRSYQKIQKLAKEANDILTNVNLVSGISDVPFFIDYEEYGNEGESIFQKLEGTFEDLDDDVLALYHTAECMAGKSKMWHSSTC